MKVERLTALDMIEIEPLDIVDPLRLVSKMPSLAEALELDLKRINILVRSKAHVEDLHVLLSSTMPLRLRRWGMGPSAISVVSNLAFMSGLSTYVHKERTESDQKLLLDPGAVASIIPKNRAEVGHFKEYQLRDLMRWGDEAVLSIAETHGLKGFVGSSADFSFNGDPHTPVYLQPHLEMLFPQPIWRTQRERIEEQLRSLSWVGTGDSAVKISKFNNVAKQVAYFSKVDWWLRSAFVDRDGVVHRPRNRHQRPSASLRNELWRWLARYDIDDRVSLFRLK